MKRAGLFNKALITLVCVFGVTAVATAIFAAWGIDHNMTDEYQSKGTAIANSIAGSSIEILLYRDASTVQATIDQYLEIQGVGYVFVVNPQGEIIAHTFAPSIPEEVGRLRGDEHRTITQQVEIQGQGKFLDVSSPIVDGKAGYVHVGMDRGLIQSFIWSAILKQVGLMTLLFLLSIVAAYFLVSRIARPLNRLAGYANELAATGPAVGEIHEPAADLHSIAGRTDEVGQLTQAFVHMVRQVTTRERELRQAQEGLERRVRERTDDLVQANTRLQVEMAERQRAQDALARQTQELVRSNGELEQFASVASHDLQEPLRMVASYVELLGSRYKGKLDAKADRWIAFTVDAAARMKQLINDLLEFSRVGTRGKPMAPTAAAAVFATSVTNLEKAIQESDALVTHGPLPTVMADGTQLGQLFQNLIANALKFRGQQRPEVRMEAERQDGCWLFSVRDNGIGIDPQFAERIFVIFQRLHTREQYAGTGIGLSVCKKIVERHGGRIWVESQVGQGATFRFTIPDRREADNGAVQAREGGGDPAGGG